MNGSSSAADAEMDGPNISPDNKDQQPSKSLSGASQQESTQISSQLNTNPSHSQNLARLDLPSSLAPKSGTLLSTPASTSVSQPMTRVTSTSSNISTKDESNASGPYGTRSRNRGGPRPNYADDGDTDVEMPPSRGNDTTVKQYGAFDGETRPARNGDNPRTSTTILRLSTGLQNAIGTSKNASNAESSATPPAAQPERKKRKYERHIHRDPKRPSDDRYVAVQPKDSIPGTSQFSALPNGSGSAPPTKKRKTGDHVPPTDVRKRSVSHNSKFTGRATALITFEKSHATLKNGKLEADDGVKYAVDDHIYLVCEPPGDPYYLARIMDFRHAVPEDPKTPVVELLVNWFYRPKDINKYSADSRFLYATMQSDISPINSLRGKCQIRHRSEITEFEEYRKKRDTFWFNSLYDRYSRRPYDMIASNAVVNVPEKVKKAIDERWKFLVVETARLKEFTSAVKLCKRCSTYCAPDDSVDCGICRETWHMRCVRPPMTKKPTRGFAWSCGPCSKARERKLEERHATVITQSSTDKEDERLEDEDEEAALVAPGADDTPSDNSPEPDANISSAAQADLAQVQMWPWRYLGIHCRVEDVLQYDDRAIYPRASSRLGPRHQANVVLWYGQPVQYVKPPDVKRKSTKSSSSKKDSKLSKEALAAIENERLERAQRPKWIQDEPAGYISRGQDLDSSDPNCTATPIFVKPDEEPKNSFTAANTSHDPNDKIIDEYMTRIRELADGWGMVTISKKGDPQISTNYLDQALSLLTKNDFNQYAALAELQANHGPKELKNPDLTKEEIKKFEDGVHKFGSDLRQVRKHVKTRPHGDIVRFYYTWKFTERGDQIWGNYQGRRGAKRRAETSWPDIADDEDDSAFDNEKAVARRRNFQCKFCATRTSRQWRRAPSVQLNATVLADPKASSKDRSNQLAVALCLRCALVWRKYGMQWQDPEELAKVISQTGGRAWKRRQDEESLREIVLANEAAGVPTTSLAAVAAAAIGIVVTVPQESDRKKNKANGEPDGSSTMHSTDTQKKKAPAPQPPPPPPPPREPTPPIVPTEPRFRDFPCAVCRWLDNGADTLLVCKECKLTVHRHCYATTAPANPSAWVCDTCLNDKEERASLDYICALCPISDRQVELVEPPKVSHKKKTDRDREKERLEKDLAQKMTDDYIRRQKTKGRPPFPREALKLTASNNWIHVTCAVWTPEVKFGAPTKMTGAEGMGALLTSSSRMELVCKLCKDPRGACVSCHQCHAPFHVQCAHDAGYTFGFDITPVKGSRKDLFSTVTVGQETGSMTAAIWCKEHSVKTIVHDMTQIVDEQTSTNALQLFIQTYKHADTKLTGAARKADLLAQASKGVPSGATSSSSNRRTSMIINGTLQPSGAMRIAPRSSIPQTAHENQNLHSADTKRECDSCHIDVTLKWYPLPSDVRMDGMRTRWQCHKCHKKQESGQPSTPAPQSAPNNNVQSLHPAPDLWTSVEPASRAPGFLTASQRSPPHAILRLPQFKAALDKFAQDIWHITVEIHNAKSNKSHTFEGRHLGVALDLDCSTAFAYVQFFAGQNCDYKREQDVIVTEDGSWVSAIKQFVQALTKIVMAGTKTVRWEVKSVRETNYVSMEDTYKKAVDKQNLVWPPILTNQHTSEIRNQQRYNIPANQMRKPSYLPPMVSHGPMQSSYRPPVQSIPPLPDLMMGTLPGRAGPPYHPLASVPASLYNRPQMSPTSTSPTSTSRPQTPNDRPNGFTLNGASSSPNLKNLMH